MNRRRRIVVLAITVGAAGLALAALAVALISHALTAPMTGHSSPPRDPNSAAAQPPSSAAHPLIPELSPTTEAPLWPIPTFHDDCKPQPTPSTDAAASSTDQACDPPALAVRPDTARRQPQLELWALAVLIGAATASIAAGGYLLVRRRRADQRRRWQSATATLDDIASAIMAFELDPHSPDTRPLLGDVNEPATAHFYAAYTTAQNLRTPAIPGDEQTITAFTSAVTHARRAFEAADLNARRKAGHHTGALGSATTNMYWT